MGPMFPGMVENLKDQIIWGSTVMDHPEAQLAICARPPVLYRVRPRRRDPGVWTSRLPVGLRLESHQLVQVQFGQVAS